MLGSQGGLGQTKFLLGAKTSSGASGGTGGSGPTVNLSGGAHGQLSTDLTNFGNVVSTLKHTGGAADPATGSQTTDQVTGTGFGASGNLDQNGKELKDLLANNTPTGHHG